MDLILILCSRVLQEFTASLYQQCVIDNVTNNNVLVVVLWRQGLYDSEELLRSYEQVAECYSSSVYVCYNLVYLVNFVYI